MTLKARFKSGAIHAQNFLEVFFFGGFRFGGFCFWRFSFWRFSFLEVFALEVFVLEVYVLEVFSCNRLLYLPEAVRGRRVGVDRIFVTVGNVTDLK